jgi:hypothetical protein
MYFRERPVISLNSGTVTSPRNNPKVFRLCLKCAQDPILTVPSEQ